MLKEMAEVIALVVMGVQAAAQPSSSDSEVRLVMALLVAVAAVTLLGTLVYWVRSGDRPSADEGDSPDGPESEDTLR